MASTSPPIRLDYYYTPTKHAYIPLVQYIHAGWLYRSPQQQTYCTAAHLMCINGTPAHGTHTHTVKTNIHEVIVVYISVTLLLNINSSILDINPLLMTI